tara:strand:+ start:12473 stop:13495 length:1023 start_codon:yes stop_codon:yes gene_type:complete
VTPADATTAAIVTSSRALGVSADILKADSIFDNFALNTMECTAAFRAAAAAHALELRFGSPDVVDRIVAARSLPPPSSRSPVLKSAHDALALVRELHGFVARSRGAYLQETNDADVTRDGIETEVRLSVQACQAHVDMLKSMVQAMASTNQNTPHAIAHLHGVVLIVTERLARVASAFDQCREVRYKKVLAEAERRRRRAPTFVAKAPGDGNDTYGGGGEGEGGGGGDIQSQTQMQSQIKLTTRELLTDELAGVADQVRAAEASVVEISALSSLFAQHIHTQAAQIEQLYSQAVESTKNLQTGNVELRKTIKRRGDAQRFVGYLLFLATFLLMFVDWISG